MTISDRGRHAASGSDTKPWADDGRRSVYRVATMIDRVLGMIERASVLEPAADKVSEWISRIVPSGIVRDVASGTPAGHPLHPPLTALSIGSLSAGTVLQVTGAGSRATRRAIGLGLLAALPTAYSGASDWSHTAGAERRVGLVHAGINDLAVTCYLAGLVADRRGRRAAGGALYLSGWALLCAGGMLGGHLGYGMGVGVDTTSFQHLDTDWLDVAAESAVPAQGAMLADAGGVPVLLARHAGSVVAMADRCTHRGGPLHEGQISDGCVQCPWHGSRFDLADGSVAAGPAVRPQPTFAVRVADGRVHVRREEPRALRSRPVS